MFCMALSCLLSSPAFAYDFVPTDQEFNAWPIWCRNVYLSTDIGKQSKFAGLAEAADAAQARKDFDGFWHYCAGLAWLSRAQVDPDPSKAEWEYHRAIDETMFNYSRTPPTHKLRGQMSTLLGLAYRGLEEWEQSIDYLRRSTVEAPEYVPAYSALGLVYRQRGKLTSARDVLVQGIKVADGKAPELHYFLGLVYFDLKDIDAAREQADLAYAQGYPLPGLRKKLESVSR
jgi:tetratricopeptide (TPR) repeat protein